ncbi:L,D-transpeptidase [Streptomyces sp. NPDC094049]|uniref:L,D-transpeptidase n=1 Tax=Streptomyces sp. NPDC094049 TaxID=3154987 RepID=UPI003322D81E
MTWVRPLTALVAAVSAALIPMAAVAVPGEADPVRPVRSGAAPAGAAACSTSTGPYQREAERHLGLPVDGKQSPEDCRAIAAFQRRVEIEPAEGYAGLYTYRAIVWERAVAEGSAIKGCPDRSGLVVCVDKTRQILWVEDGGRLVVAPVPARSGRPGYETRSGWFTVYQREKEFWSTQFDGPMPFAQFFSGGQALHASYRPIFEDPGSHGCVNLRYEDARVLWNLLREGDAVYVWGSRSDG